jgi:hypothetical protein
MSQEERRNGRELRIIILTSSALNACREWQDLREVSLSLQVRDWLVLSALSKDILVYT